MSKELPTIDEVLSDLAGKMWREGQIEREFNQYSHWVTEAKAHLERLIIDARFDELSKIPVIETTGVGYETIVSHRLKRFRDLYNAQDRLTHQAQAGGEDEG